MVAGIRQAALADDLEAVGETIFSEVERMDRHLGASFLGKDELSQRVLGTFRRIADKLDALSFADYRIDPVVRSLRAWLARLPATGAITGGLFLEGWALMRLVGDAEAMARHGAGLLALAELMPRETSGQALAGRPEGTVDADETAGSADVNKDAVSGVDAQTDSDALAPVSADTQTKPAEEPSTSAEPIAEFDGLFNDDPLDGQDVAPGLDSTSMPASQTASVSPEPISAQDFWF